MSYSKNILRFFLALTVTASAVPFTVINSRIFGCVFMFFWAVSPQCLIFTSKAYLHIIASRDGLQMVRINAVTHPTLMVKYKTVRHWLYEFFIHEYMHTLAGYTCIAIYRDTCPQPACRGEIDTIQNQVKSFLFHPVIIKYLIAGSLQAIKAV